MLDPDFEFTVGYRLRWEAKNETAYPATFVVDSSGKITFAKISMSHGERASADEVLKALGGKTASALERVGKSQSSQGPCGGNSMRQSFLGVCFLRSVPPWH